MNPPPNYQRILREETKADEFLRKKREAEFDEHNYRPSSATRRLLAAVKGKVK